MFINTYSQEGKEVSKTKLPEEIFGVKLNPDLVHQVVVSQMANRRQISAHTKDRSEVRGGGRKPWRQKGTGRARHGSIRSPLWKGGGVTFGPRKDKVYKKEIPKKMRRKALLMVLSAKARNNLLLLLDTLELKAIKTKEIAGILGNLLTKELKNQTTKEQPSMLLALSTMDENIILSARNIPKVATIQAKDLNCLDLLCYKYLLMPKDAIRVIEETFVKKSKGKTTYPPTTLLPFGQAPRQKAKVQVKSKK